MSSFPLPTTTLRVVSIVALGLCFSNQMALAQEETILWSMDWEADQDWTLDWHVEGGTWQIGKPTSGPGEAHADSQLAATTLEGNYVDGIDARLVRHTTFVVPDSTESPRLRFWHWYSFSSLDYGEVQLRVVGGEWKTVSERYASTGCGIWSRAYVDLSAFAGETVELAFLFHSRLDWPDPDVSSGWYLDELRVVTGSRETLEGIETWESGIGSWVVDHNGWQVGTPEGGTTAFGGSQCAGTLLKGHYCDDRDSRLISPPVTIPEAGREPRLRFWHWYSLSTRDTATIEVRVGDGEWTPIGGPWTSTSCGGWTRAFVDLRDYAEETVQLAFHFHSRMDWPDWDVSWGWYVDNVMIETGTRGWWANPRDWVPDIGNWYVTAGQWEIGRATAGPDSCHGDAMCAGTILDGKYCDDRTSLLVSPPVLIPGPADSPRLGFWHWFSLSTRDEARVMVRPVGGEWSTLTRSSQEQVVYTGSGGGEWSYDSIGLQDYVNQRVEFAFRIKTQMDWPDWDVSWGWYVDDIRIFGRVPTLLADAAAEVTDRGVVLRWSLTTGTTVEPSEFLVDRVRLRDEQQDRLSSAQIQSNGTGYRLRDSSVEAGEEYRYRVTLEDGTLLFRSVTLSIPTRATALHPCHPNPFNPSAVINFEMGRSGPVHVAIYDVRGALVKTLEDGRRRAGTHRLQWDGTDDRGERVASGAYSVRLRTEDFEGSRRLLLLK